MALYMIGDVQGCDAALERLLQRVGFSASRDTLYLLGDLVNRGPDSLAVLRRLRALGGSAHALLGNHDLHLLAVAHGVRPPHRQDTLSAILQATDRAALLEWLRQRPLALQAAGWLMVHAGLLPQWSAADALALAGEVTDVLRGPDGPDWLHELYGNEPKCWDQTLQGPARWRVIVNGLTRLRFCSLDGTMDFSRKDSALDAPPGYLPWFEVPDRRSLGTRVAFGHWSTLGLLQRDGLLGLDTGCVWGGHLSAARFDDLGSLEVLQVPCEQACAPG